MSDAKGFNQSHDPAPRQAEASAEAGASTQQPTRVQASAATQYWQSVAAAGRAAKPATAAPAETARPGLQRSVRA